MAKTASPKPLPARKQTATRRIPKPGPEALPQFDWRTTDEEEIRRRQERAREEQPRIRNLDPAEPFFSRFKVSSPSGMRYTVEVRDLAQRRFSCTCTDFRNNALGTCKHVEAVLHLLQARHRTAYRAAAERGSSRWYVVPDPARDSLRLENPPTRPSTATERFFTAEGRLRKGVDPAEAAAQIAASRSRLTLAQEVNGWLELRERRQERVLLRREYEQKVRTGEYPPHETRVPLYPYQREGMLHLAFQERALLADEMGLGKTIQAIAACALLHRLGKAKRVLVVTPASLKTEWEEQIQRFTALPYQVIYGQRHERLKAFAAAPFFTLVNYEQMLRDAMDVNRLLRPDIVVLDEAQRIKNWSTKTAQAIKRLESRYAFVLTGTPIENRIDELYSLVDFLDPAVFGPLFRFNREFYEFDDRGRPEEYKNLEALHERVRPLMLRRRKAEVETELPGRTDRNLFIPLSPGQREAYEDHAQEVGRLVMIAKRRPLTKQQQEKLMRELAMMRMLCDTTYILDPSDPTSPKVDEIERVLEDCLGEPETKVIIFSEWERMLELIRHRLKQTGVGYAWHTGSVPQRRRRGEILAFKSDPDCRVFLSTDSGGVGLNLQNASIVINCDLPWNPAKLEQRIGRAWRKHQTRAVTVINMVAEDTIEHRMLGTLSAKQALADGVLDRIGDFSAIKLKAGANAFLNKLQQIITTNRGPVESPEAKPPLPVDRSGAFAARAREILGDRLIACEERFPSGAPHSVLIVTVASDAPSWRARLADAHEELLGRGKSDPLAPVHLEVIDRTTAEALQRLADAGLYQPAVRAIRHLHLEDPAKAPALTAEEQQQWTAHRSAALRNLKVAQVLAGGGCEEESLAPLKLALLATAQALAVRKHLPPPQRVDDVLLPPFDTVWGASSEVVRDVMGGRSFDGAVLASGLEQLLAE